MGTLPGLMLTFSLHLVLAFSTPPSLPFPAATLRTPCSSKCRAGLAVCVSWDELVSARRTLKSDLRMLATDLEQRQPCLAWRSFLNILSCRVAQSWQGDSVWTDEFERAWQQNERETAAERETIDARNILDDDEFYADLLSTCSRADLLADNECAQLTGAAYAEMRK